MARFASLEAGCREYIEILNKPPNGWGQHIGPDGQSHHTLMRLHREFGAKAVTDELNRQFNGHKSNAAHALAS